MRRNAVLEGLQQEAELIVRPLRRKAQDLEHLGLHVALMDTDRAAAHLHAVEYDIVSLGAHPARVGVNILQILVHGHGEGMVHGHEAAFLLGVFKERELRHPQELKIILFQQIQLPCQFQAQIAQHVVDHLVAVRGKQQQIARLAAHGGHQRAHLLLRHELGKGRFQAAVLVDRHISQTLGPETLGILHQGVDLLSGHMALALGVDAADGTAALQGVLEHRELAALHYLRHVLKLHTKAQVRLVGAETVHGLLPGHPGQGKGQVVITNLFKQLLQQTLIDVQHLVHVHKGQLHVDLGELRLSVRPQILVPVAAGDLEIAVITRAHEQLLEQLGRLGQRVK